jgi:Fe-S cluster assembly protein SufD
MSAKLAALPAYAEQFDAARPALPGAGAAWLEALRSEALIRFGHSGFPTPKVEAWKFTDLGRLATLPFDNTPAVIGQPLTRADLTRFRLAPECRLAVFVNGQFRADLSEFGGADGLEVADFARADDDALRALAAPPLPDLEPHARALADLNTAFMRDGAVIRVRAGAMPAPVQLLFVAAPQEGRPVFHLRNLIRVESGAVANVVETYVGHNDRAYWTNAVTRIELAERATLAHCKLQAEGRAGVHVGVASVRVGGGASYRLFAASLGGELARNEIEVDLAAPDAAADLTGVTLARGKQHLDTTIRLGHAVPRGASHQEFRSVVDDEAHAVFQGSVRVAPDAQKTDARQLNHSLLLSPSAAADTKPELEILADDVKCSHGATVGDLDRDSLFYLRARGIGEAEARALLIAAFIGDLIDGIESESVRTYVRRNVDAWLQELAVKEKRS